MSVNIAHKARLNEVNYRYRRETIQIVHENFKGVVTRITNLATIAKQIQSHVADLEKGLVKQIKKELAISTCGPLTFPGKREAQDFDNVLQIMIEKYVLCPRCFLPEWDRESCKACGHQKNSKKQQQTTSKKGKAEQHPDDEEHNSFETVAPVAEEKWVGEVSRHMHTLYDQRWMCLKDQERTKTLDKELDLCWSLQTEKQWQKFKMSSFQPVPK